MIEDGCLHATIAIILTILATQAITVLSSFAF